MLCRKENQRAKRGTSWLNPKGKTGQPTAAIPVPLHLLLEKMRQITSPRTGLGESPACPLLATEIVVLVGEDWMLCLTRLPLLCSAGRVLLLKKKKQKKKKASFCRKAPHVVLFHPTRTSVSTAMHCTGKTCYSPRRVRPLGFLQPKGDSGSGRTSFPVTNGVTEGKCKEMQFAYV